MLSDCTRSLHSRDAVSFILLRIHTTPLFYIFLTTPLPTAVAGLVDSIRKHKKFKQLASYSIQCIEKVITPPRIGWETHARAAFELGAAEDIADVCQRFATDAEVFALSISSLKGIGSVPRAGAVLSGPSVAGPIIQAIASYFSSVDCAASGAAEALARLGPATDLLILLVRYDASAFGAVGGISTLLGIVSQTPPPAVALSAAASQGALVRTPSKGGNTGGAAGSPASLAAAYSALIASCTSILERASRVKAGLDALMPANNVAQLLTVATLNLNPPEAPRSKWEALRSNVSKRGSGGALGASRRSLASIVLQSTRGGGAAASSDGAASPGGTAGGPAGAPGRDLNGHLAPAFRILDRIARSDAGRDLLLAQGATQRLSSIMVRELCVYCARLSSIVVRVG